MPQINQLQKSFKVIFPIIGSVALLFFSYLMLNIILPYRTGETDIDFLLTKQRIIHFFHYRLAFYLHIFPSLLVLIAGLTQFSSQILKHKIGIHRLVGKVYVFIVLLISGPAALVMSVYANGGLVSKTGFVLLSLLWWVFTFQGYQTARKGNIDAHRKFMIRSYALTLSAISLRAIQFLIYRNFYLNPELVYTFLSWFSWVGNLLVAEIWIKVINKKTRFQKN